MNLAWTSVPPPVPPPETRRKIWETWDNLVVAGLVTEKTARSWKYESLGLEPNGRDPRTGYRYVLADQQSIPTPDPLPTTTYPAGGYAATDGLYGRC